ncbi:dihydropteroate synthase [Marinifilum sp. D714]|uniref:dihydropteroate synthase n=1 Tax=Marinifilum sp. D714 TaxID=2937523 RepID=UPI0027BBCC20|nr:dihydropteroate synthase [Marinifilum sp. D714]MDQ2177112.1 dihydropteroate synthase [Marinifilum sp. D714]
MIKCGNHSINFETPLVMGILNITPDSFYDGGNYTEEKTILNRAENILSEGADIIDIGAFSTRPGADDVSEAEECNRMAPAIKAIRNEFPQAILSIDTFRSNIAKRIVNEFGACVINDISGGTMDENMFETIGELQVPYIMMHIKGTPQTMQKNPYYNDLIGEIKTFFEERIVKLNQYGVKDVVLDPGFGFGKTLEHNYEIIARLNEFSDLKFPILAGLSRKSMIYKYLGGTPDSSLNGSTALNMMCLENGANILRVHDVKEAVECVKLHNMIKSQLK